MKNDKYLKSVSKKIIINERHQRVWEVISKPGNLEICHPFCEYNPVEKWPSNKSIDYVKYYNGLEYQRIFTDWIDGQGYDLLIGRKNGGKSKVTWRINKLDESSCELKITIFPHDILKYPSFAKPLIFSLYARPMIRKYLTSVLKGFQFYIMQGKPIQKNQFGTHRWFSD
ncbi:MAG: hypothetical protein V3U16_09450 [Candidatus Neomarinimicrobiota bacterium]